ncbi:MAG: GAF domain-containing protein [Acidobacteria bacterium]|nr:GAF domain-containing protein [Acidobacteriota bacterium]
MAIVTALLRSRRPGRPYSIFIGTLFVVLWIVLRLTLFPSLLFPLTYVLPLLICVWTRDRLVLWGMAGAFAVAALAKFWWVLPVQALSPLAWRLSLAATLANIVVGAVAVHLVIALILRLENSEAFLRAANDELQAQAEELAQQSETLAQHNEELTAQGEELEAQNEELAAQAEENQALNVELHHREKMLHSLLECTRAPAGEQELLQRIGGAALELMGGAADAAVVFEQSGRRLVVRACVSTAGAAPPPAHTLDDSFAGLALEQGRTAALEDARLRPDLCLFRLEGQPPFRACLAAPLALQDQRHGLVAVYAREPRQWTADHFRVAEWLAREATLALAAQHLQARLQRSLGDLERSNRELEQFAYVASHDLQEPLRMVQAFLQLLRQRCGDQLDDKADEYLGFAVQGAQRMSQLVRSLLEYSRVQSDGLTRAEVALAGILEQALANCRAALAEAAGEVTAGELPLVYGDALQLTRLLQNLVGNALKFRAPGRPPRVHVSAEREGEAWVVSVRDNGIGVPPEERERIFLAFRRLHAQDEYPGTGIGLAICAKIVERHGGRIWAEPNASEGTTFRFTVPAAEFARIKEPA